MEKQPNNSQPLISIMISSYRQPESLKIAIKSALEQDYSNLEVIVSDDASGNDDVKNIVDSFSDSRIKLNINEKNLGRAKNYRVLLYKLAQGKYVTLLNGDDYFVDTNFISRAVSLFESEKNIGLVFGGIEKIIVETNKKIRDSYHDEIKNIVDGNWYFINYPKGFSIPHVSSIYSRSDALALDFYRIDTMSQDWESLLRVILNKKIGIFHETVAIKTQHRSNVTKTQELGHFEANAAYLYSVYNYAKACDIFAEKSLDEWLYALLKRHHTKWLIKIWYLSPEKEKDYLSYLRHAEPKIYKDIVYGPKYLGYKSIRRSKFLMKLVFKYIIKQESFIVDLQNY